MSHVSSNQPPNIHININEDAQHRINRHVIGLVANAPLSSAVTDPPIIANAYRTVIQNVARHADLPPFATFAEAIRNLSRLHSDLESQRQPPTTPLGHDSMNASTNAPQLIDALHVSPRTRLAKQSASKLARDVGKRWKSLSRRCADISSSTASGDQDDLELTVQDFFVTMATVLQTSSLLGSRFSNLDLLNHSHPALLKQAQEAVSNAAWHIHRSRLHLDPDEMAYYLLAVADLSIDQGQDPEASAQNARSDPSEEPLRLQLAQSFRRLYKGDAHLRFLRFAITVNMALFRDKPEGDRPYYRGTTIVQSSGTGKSRMLLQLGRSVPLLFVCIRPKDTTSARNGYPLGDKSIMDLALIHLASKPGSADLKAALLFAAWFDILASRLEDLDSPHAKFEYLVQLNNFGNAEHEEQRNHFFDAVAGRVRADLLFALAATASNASHSVIFQTHLNVPLRRLSDQISLMQPAISTTTTTTSTSATSATGADEPLVFVAIDECVSLPTPFLDSICRAWAFIGEWQHEQRQAAGQSPVACFWLVLLSTNSSATVLIRPQHEHTSLRDKAAVPLPTFVGVGFDVLRSELPPLTTASEVADLVHIQKYGRPLWISLAPSRFWPTAVAKLLGTSKFVRGVATTCFNVLASRLALEYMPTRGADQTTFGQQATFARDAVDRHMRILDGVDQDAVLRISSPSEPVLAVAASLVMMPTPIEARRDQHVPLQSAVNRYGSMLETLKTMCLVSADVDILRGMRGELLTRLLLMTAWDAVKLRDPTFATTEDLALKAQHLLQPVRLENILEALVTLDPPASAKVRDRISQICARVAAQDASAWVHYTHFDVLNVEVREISSQYLWYCWKRGVAIQMAHPQHGIDGIIPVFVGNLSSHLSTSDNGGHHDESVAISSMTYIAWEAKNKSRHNIKLAHDPKHAGPLLKDDENADQPSLTRRGLLTILADIGASDTPPAVKTIHRTDALQIWLQGFGLSYPCLDTLQIRQAVTELRAAVESRTDFDVYNRISDPMDLDAPARLDSGGGDEQETEGETVDTMDVSLSSD